MLERAVKCTAFDYTLTCDCRRCTNGRIRDVVALIYNAPCGTVRCEVVKLELFISLIISSDLLNT